MLLFGGGNKKWVVSFCSSFIQGCQGPWAPQCGLAIYGTKVTRLDSMHFRNLAYVSRRDKVPLRWVLGTVAYESNIESTALELKIPPEHKEEADRRRAAVTRLDLVDDGDATSTCAQSLTIVAKRSPMPILGCRRISKYKGSTPCLIEPGQFLFVLVVATNPFLYSAKPLFCTGRRYPRFHGACATYGRAVCGNWQEVSHTSSKSSATVVAKARTLCALGA